MTWADRQAFLRGIGPIRFSVLCSGLLWAKSILDLIRDWHTFLQNDSLRAWSDSIFVVLALSGALQGILAFYLCWLDWQYANAIGEVAGGTTATMREWSRLFYRLNWIGAAWIGLALATEILRWLAADVLAY